MFKLQNKIELIVPQYDNEGNEISSAPIKLAIKQATRTVGGNTITPVKGQWWSEDEERIMQDDNLNIEWYYDLNDMDRELFASAIAKIIRQLIIFHEQEAVSLKLNGTLYIIEYEDLEFLSYDLYQLFFKN